MRTAAGKIKALIVDDERLARERLQRLLGGEPEVEVVGQCANAAQATEMMASKGPNVLFLDVEMPRGSGFELLQKVDDSHSCAVVFVTAYEQYAVQAFAAQACDYLLKPVEGDRLRAALERARRYVRHLQSERQPPAITQNAVLIRSGSKTVRIPVEAIDWIEAAGNYVYVHSAGKTHLMRETIGSFEAGLPAPCFVRIHRNAIVNLERIVEFQQSFHGDLFVVLQDGQQLKMSRTYRDRVRDLFGRSV